MSPIHTATTCFHKTYYNITLTFTFKSPCGLFLASFWSKSCMPSRKTHVLSISFSLICCLQQYVVQWRERILYSYKICVVDRGKKIVVKRANQTVYLFRWLLQWGFGTAQSHNISTSGTREMVSMGPYPFTECGAEILSSTVCHSIPSPASWLQTATKPSSWRSCGSGCQNWQ